MRRVLFGLVIGLILVTPSTVSAWKESQQPKIIKATSCGSSYNGESQCRVEISTFDDAGNKCYLATGGSHKDVPSISCVKE